MNTYKKEFLKPGITSEQLRFLLNDWFHLCYEEQQGVISEDDRFNTFNDRLKGLDMSWDCWSLNHTIFINCMKREGMDSMEFDNGLVMTFK